MRFSVSAFSVALIAALALAALVVGRQGAPEEKRGDDLTPVTVADVRRVGQAEPIEAAGTLVLKRETELSFKVAGIIAALDVRAGDAIKSDQLLASLDQTEAAAREREAAAQLELTRKEYQRSSDLFAKGFVAARRVEDAKASLQRAQAGFDVAHFDKRWTELRAPWDGVVLNRSAEAGEMVAPGRVVLAIGDTTGGFNLMAPIADRDVARLAVGDRAQATFAALDAPIEGRVARLTAKADTHTGSFEAEIALDVRSPVLRSGMIGEVKLYPSAEAGTSALAIPAEAVVEGDGDRASVYVLKSGGDVVELREVHLIRIQEAQALVGSGVAEGERVVVSGAAYVRSGETVRIVGPQSAEVLRNTP